jgi:hypothetical protein
MSNISFTVTEQEDYHPFVFKLFFKYLNLFCCEYIDLRMIRQVNEIV